MQVVDQLIYGCDDEVVYEDDDDYDDYDDDDDVDNDEQ
jgi:hypothetical protein